MPSIALPVSLRGQLLSGVRGFSPSSLFILSEPGVWYDPSDLTTLFQDTAGTTPVTTPGDRVGLMLDKSKGLFASTKGGQMDGIVGGSFDTPSATANQITGDIDIRMRISLLSWTPAAITALCSRVLTGGSTGDSYEFWINTSGVLQLLTVSGTTNTNVASSASVGFAAGTTNWVRVTWQQSTGFVNFYTSSDGVTWTQNGTANRAGTTSATNAGTRLLRFGARSDGASGSFPLNGKIYRAQVYNGINGTLAVDFNPTLYASGATFTAATGEVWTITGLYARIVPDGFHATQSTSGARPTYGIVPLGGRRNLLTFTEQFDNAAWAKDSCTISANATTAPDGTATADRIVSANALAQTGVGQSATVQTSVAYTASYYVKANGARYVQLLWGSASSANFANFDLQTGTITGGTYTSATITPAANDFYRITITSTISTTTVSSFVWLLDSGTSLRAGSYTGNGTSGIFIWGAQLELGSTASAYQRVGSVYDVTEAGVPSRSYINFDGTDDAMVTSTITPGIDKAQIFAGVRKLSDAAQGVIAESSANWNGSAGTFLFYTGTSTTAGPNYSSASRGSASPEGAQFAVSAASFAAPITNVVTATHDIAGDLSAMRVNGAASGTNGTLDKGTGDFLAYPIYLGARGGTSRFFNGNLFSLIVRFGTNLDAATIASTETWVTGKTELIT